MKGEWLIYDGDAPRLLFTVYRSLYLEDGRVAQLVRARHS